MVVVVPLHAKWSPATYGELHEPHQLGQKPAASGLLAVLAVLLCHTQLEQAYHKAYAIHPQFTLDDQPRQLPRQSPVFPASLTPMYPHA